MARDFKIELDNVEMINGSDDLLKDTKVTKVTLTGENKLNSLNSTFENCTELTAIEGDVNLDGVSDMTEMTLNTPLDELKVTNPTEENIQTDNSLNQVTNVKIGGTKYAKGGIQDVVGSLEWTAENFTYEDTILDNVYTNSSSIEDSKNLTISNTLEQKATSIEITGQTYENLVDGKATKNLLDEMSMQQTEGKPTQFTPHMEQPICLEYIEGQTYQNLIKGKGEYKLTDTFSTTWTESNNSIENPPSMIEIPEIFGNTVQGYANLITNQQLADSVNSITWTDAFAGINPLVAVDSRGFKFNDYAGSIDGSILQDIANSPDAEPIKLKANTTYSLAIKEGSHSAFKVYSRTSRLGGQVFTTDSTGEVFIIGIALHTGFSNIVLVEGNDPQLINKASWFDLSYIQSVGDLYVDESGEPILDEEGNKQYKLELISNDGNSNSNKTTILMPQPLRKVGNYRDRLYWDNDKSKFLIKGCTWEVKKFIPKSKFTLSDGYMKTNSCNGYDGKGDNLYPENQGTLISNFGVGNSSYTKEGVWVANKNTHIALSIDRFNSIESDSIYLHYIYGIYTGAEYLIETKILEKPSLETYSPKTYITTSAEIQPSQMSITNKEVKFIPLSLQPSKAYTVQLDSVGKDNKPITVNLGGATTTIQPTNDTSKHHRVSITTPSSLTTDNLDLSGEGVVVNDVMLFEGGGNEIRQEVEYVEGIQNIGEVQICKNLFPNVNFIAGGLNGKGEVQASNTDMVTEDFVKIKLESSKTYCISNTENLNWICVCFYDINKTFISQKSTSGTVLVIDSIPSNSEYVKISCYNGLKKEIKFQIEEGSIATEYQQYFEGEKYKIDILSNDGNKIFDADTWVNSTLDGTMSNSGFYKVLGSNMIEIIANDGRISNQIKQIQLKPNTKYSILCNDASLTIYIFFKLQGTGQISGRSKIDFTTDETGRIGFKIPDGVGKIVKIDIVDEKGFNYSAWSTQSILLPQPLNKIGDIKDKFYWDDDKEHYCIEQNIDKNLEVLETPKIIDLPHLNKKYSLDTYMPTTYVDVTNLPLQPYGLLLEDDTVRYKSTIEPSTLYTIQFNCLSKLTTRLTLDLGGTRKTVDPIIGVNHVQITTPSELASDRLFLIGTGIVVKEVIVNKGTMNQYPKYFDGGHSVGELQTDGSYKIVIKTNEGFTVTIRTSSPLTKLDKIYWNNIDKRYEIDRNGVIEVPTVEGDIIDLPRLYQKIDTTINISTDNIKPSKIAIEYNDINNN